MLKLTEMNRKWWVLFAMVSAISLIFIDVTVLPVALPTIQRTLGFTDLGLQWIVNAYTLALTVFVMAGGRMGDRFGHKRIFFLGQLFFGLGSILCGLSYYQWFFIIARAIQGFGAALLMPSALAIVFNAFPPNQRGKALGIYIGLGSIFLTLGPLVGGTFTQYWSWRLVFWINLPVLLAGFLLARFAVLPSKKRNIAFDFRGFATFGLGITFLIVGLMQTRNWSWFSPLTVSFLLIGLFFLFLMYRIDSKAKNPFIDLKLLKKRAFAGALCSTFLTQMILIVTIFWAMYFQNVLGFSPSQAGILGFLANLPIILAAPLGGHLLDQRGVRLPIVLGFIFVAGALIWLTQVLDYKSIPLLLSALIPFGIGIPFILTSSATAALSEVPSEHRAMATATTTTIRQFGATLGLAIFGALFFDAKGKLFAEDLKRNVETFHLDPIAFQGLLAKKSQAVAVWEKLSAQSQLFVTNSLINASIEAFWLINVVASLLALSGLTLALVFFRKKPKR